MFKQSQPDLGFQNRPHGIIELSGRDFSGRYKLWHIFDEGVARHIHIQPGGNGTIRSVLAISGKTMGHKIADSDGIRNHEALEAPRLAQNVVQEPSVASSGDVV